MVRCPPHKNLDLFKACRLNVFQLIHRQLQELVSDNSNSGLKISSLKLYERYQKVMTEKNIAMDDIKPETIQKLENLGEALVKENKDSLNKLCDVLVRN